MVAHLNTGDGGYTGSAVPFTLLLLTFIFYAKEKKVVSIQNTSVQQDVTN
ncbi:MAG: hypothetical protein ACJAZ2_000781 [Glaciecola sp.]|jgi:hypothetical protein